VAIEAEQTYSYLICGSAACSIKDVRGQSSHTVVTGCASRFVKNDHTLLINCDFRGGQ
jgi:hypothetical protein